MRKKKVISFSLIFIFLFFSFVFSQEIEYPPLPGAPQIEESTPFPQYAKYLFNFFILISGIIALGVLIWAGILWILSAGDPSKIEEAKSKAITSFLGLVILLFSYVVVITINPKMSIFYLKETRALSGIYIMNATNKAHLRDSSKKLPFSDTNEITFISPPTSLKKIYLFPDTDFKGKRVKIENNGGTVSVSPPINSIYFVWKNGLYLFDESDFEINNFDFPIKIESDENDLGKWSTTTNSIEVVGAKAPIKIGAFLFAKKNFKGECGYIFCENNQSEIPDLNLNLGGGGNQCSYDNSHGMANDKLSSLLLFTLDSRKEYSGRVIFYEEIGCKGSSNEINVPSTGQAEGHFSSFIPKSFKLEGNFKVVLVDEDDEICQGEWKPNPEGCVEMIKGSEVYSPTDSGIRPTKYYIFPKELKL